ncbi:MAG: response regulator [Patescibacteria group bacterium]
MKKVFLLDDTDVALNYLKKQLNEKYPGQYDFYQAYNVAEFTAGVMELGERTRGMIFIIGLYLKASPEDGIRCVKYLRRDGYKNPIFVWSKWANEYRQKALDAGADDVFEKCVEDEKLLAAIDGIKSTPVVES